MGEITEAETEMEETTEKEMTIQGKNEEEGDQREADMMMRMIEWAL